ncbi:AI-2E family transporter [Undibacterium sp. CY18W]|uniref:AI-2E family transporter n=1 Tax=Undibacterium hunanense TaxID=2762292 RepID=A0ABR6ZYP1_9BURK|nr:AI-2E family transporter [Undibacterium hunanense]MBC3920959.1 AI-2E family transporter [Undibacterium hunanense]
MNQRESGPVVWLGVLTATCLLLILLPKVLLLVVPFLLAMILYYILIPAVSRLTLFGLPRETAALLVGGLFFIIMGGVLGYAITTFATRMGSLQELVTHYVDGGLQFVRNTMQSLEGNLSILRKAHASETVDAWMMANTDNFAQQYAANILMSVASFLPVIFLTPFLTFFFLRDGRKFKHFLARAVPNAFFEETLYLMYEVGQTARRYFQGLLKLTVIDTVILALGLWMIGMSSPLVLALISAILAWVPFVGSVMGCIMVVLVAATDAPDVPLLAYGAIAVFVMVRLLDDFIFMPLTLGRSLHMHPLISVLMIIVGGELAGVPGLMLVLPLLGVAMVIGETVGHVVTNQRLRARHRHAKIIRKNQASADLI